MEEDDTSEATVDTIVCAEENLPKLSAVLLCVLHPYLGQPFRHAACGERTYKVVIVFIVHIIFGLSLLILIAHRCPTESRLLTHRLICSQDALPWRNYT